MSEFPWPAQSVTSVRAGPCSALPRLYSCSGIISTSKKHSCLQHLFFLWEHVPPQSDSFAGCCEVGSSSFPNGSEQSSVSTCPCVTAGGRWQHIVVMATTSEEQSAIPAANPCCPSGWGRKMCQLLGNKWLFLIHLCLEIPSVL